MSSRVVLVDEDDHSLGTAEKLQAHVEGQLHRAISVFVFDEQDRLLLQQRAHEKYHSGGLWSNTCCTHPRPDEPPLAAARRRLQEEMGFSCALTPAFEFTYRATVEPNLIEHEYDHVFVGRVGDVNIQPDPEEVADWAWMPLSAIRDDVAVHPDRYTAWFHRLLDHIPDEFPPASLSAETPTANPTG